MKAISAKDLKDLMDKEAPYLVDVRTEEERREWRIDDSLWIPVDEIPERSDEIPKDRPVYLYCRSGNRSGMVAEQLEAFDFHNLINVTGGIVEYEQVGGTIIRDIPGDPE